MISESFHLKIRIKVKVVAVKIISSKKYKNYVGFIVIILASDLKGIRILFCCLSADSS
tara:strand:+ start:302 stop:475 length:174 start_codon:yes stop_codon:yes gene_type:complete